MEQGRAQSKNKTFSEMLMSMDRRWVFLVLGIVTVGALLSKFTIKQSVTPEVRDIYNFVENLKPSDNLLVAIDYDPNAKAELHPMAYAILEQAMARKIHVITLTLSQNGAGLADQAVRDVVDSVATYDGFRPEYGKDYVFLGYRPYYALVILGMGQNFRIPFPKDYFGNVLDSLPMMKRVQNYDQIAGVIDITGSNVADAWIANANGRYGVKVALGLTGVSGADYYPYFQSRQIFGLMVGMKGAAEYETLTHNPGPAMEAMGVQTFAHIVIILFILIGNVGYFLDRRAQNKRARQL
jgi:hypothetical protein